MSDESNDQGEAPLAEQILDVETADGPMAVLHKRPEGPPRATIALFHDGPGVRESTHAFARRLATTGYEVVIPDLYHRHGRLIGFEPDETAADPSRRDQIMTMLRSLTDDGIQSDLDDALAALDDVPETMGVIGFCLGARAVFRTMMRQPERFPVGAMWHPSFLVDDEPDSPHLLAGELRGPLYIGQGDADTVMSLETNTPFLEAVARRGDTTVIDIHPGAEHGYTWPSSPNHDAAAASRSWDKTIELFEAVVG